jgi:hypothetical protein
VNPVIICVQDSQSGEWKERGPEKIQSLSEQETEREQRPRYLRILQVQEF